MKKMFITLSMAVLLLALIVPTVFAQDATPVTVTGVVNSVDIVSGTVTVQFDTDLIAFIAPADFDFTSVAAGDTVTVTYTEEAGVKVVSEILKVVAEEPTPEPTPDPLQVTGTVTAVDEANGTVTIETGTETYTIVVPTGFVFSEVAVGDTLDVTMLKDENGVWVASVVVVTPAPEETEVSGEVVSFSVEDGTVTIKLEDGTLVTIHLPEGFDFTNLHEGDSLTALVSEDENGEPVASEVTVTPGEEEEEDQPATRNPAYCSAFGAETDVEGEEGEVVAGKHHPVGEKIAATYNVTYEEVMGYFCHGAGFGQIMLALQTQEITQTPAGDLLQLKKEQGGWGQLWHSLGIVKNPKHAQPPVDDETGEPTEQPTDESTAAPTDDPTAEATEEVAPQNAKNNGNQGQGSGSDKQGDTLQPNTCEFGSPCLDATQVNGNSDHAKQQNRPVKTPKAPKAGKH